MCDDKPVATTAVLSNESDQCMELPLKACPNVQNEASIVVRVVFTRAEHQKRFHRCRG
jgi:hypothetical protein